MTKEAILIVEEEALIRMESVDIVNDAGFTALEARDADEALKILATRSDIRVVFVEAKISGSIDGITLGRIVRERCPGVQLIVTSGLSVADEDELPDGAVFIPKPYSSEQVTAALVKLFSYRPRLQGVSGQYQSWRTLP